MAVHNARLLDQVQRLSVRLQTALTSRATIDQAVGMIMARSGLSADEAFVRLRSMSQHQHTQLTLVAERLVDQAIGRARAHPPDPPVATTIINEVRSPQLIEQPSLARASSGMPSDRSQPAFPDVVDYCRRPVLWTRPPHACALPAWAPRTGLLTGVLVGR